MRINHLIIIFVYVFLLSSCITNFEELSVDDTQIPDEVSYSRDIQPIFNSTCGGGGCHVNNTAFGVNLTDYDRTMNSRGNQYGTEVVIIGDAEASPLIDKVEPNPDFGSRMPLGANPLSPTQIQLIRDWIDQGAKDN
ncbi:hypothetical protein AB2B38_001135 [Balneola sp. MJW-20]|uniref:hypothetical protein n=1 Tax=Gracilimonas aurantiaca TaxID=3234185 RepID=UPI003467C0F7